MHSMIPAISLVTFLIAPKLILEYNIMHLSIITYFQHHMLFIMQQNNNQCAHTHGHIYTMHSCIDYIIPHKYVMHSTMMSWKVWPTTQHIIQTLPTPCPTFWLPSFSTQTQHQEYNPQMLFNVGKEVAIQTLDIQ
jgi:hypothetical protein